jgi:hypothetical protein
MSKLISLVVGSIIIIVFGVMVYSAAVPTYKKIMVHKETIDKIFEPK